MTLRDLIIGTVISGVLTLAVVLLLFAAQWWIVALAFPAGAVFYLIIQLLAGDWRSV